MISPLQRRIADELRASVGVAGVLTSEEDLLAYGYHGTWLESRPLVVVLPETTAQVSAIHRLASRERLGRGAGADAPDQNGRRSVNSMNPGKIFSEPGGPDAFTV
jgi:hypothetical protein